MSWYTGDLPAYMPVCRQRRQGKFSRDYEIELWSHSALYRDYGVGIREWIQEAKQSGRKIAAHYFVPGSKVERIVDKQRDLWHKVWRQAAEQLEFSIMPELDIWWNIPLLEGRKLQYKGMQLAEDMHNAGMKLIWLLLDIKAAGDRDLDWYANYANKNEMKWVSTNLQGARDNTTFKEMLKVLASYHMRLDPKINILVNGPSSESRIRMVYRIFEGRKISIANAAKIEYRRRGFA